ncbi:MFS transporter [Pseudomonadales bacterium]|nr:MFS transporter [Pseudomonadales bacterium]MDB4068630.1 MFS transporter [Pseudomonadales bacterium]MDB9866265.1 MFS transporter [Pseudomonadales bacterium]MDB9879023.1 MFS transporter [Pseudomonadales bacterium]MDC1306548.1 MFS transporter [Pseudomonadales bacterium]
MDLEALEQKHAERRYELQVRRDLNRNFYAHLAHGMLGQTGFRLINAPTFLPAYIMLLSGGSEMMVGLALSLQALGMTLTPFVGANLIEHRKRVLPVGFFVGGMMRLSVLLIALSGLLFGGTQALIAIMICLTLLGLSQGMQGVIFNFLMSKVIPVKKRGRLTGLRNFLAGITSAAVAWLGGHYLLGETPTAQGYSFTFLLAFILTSIGLLLLLFVREPEPPTVKIKQGLWQRLGEVPALLRDDPAFTRYFLARSLATMGRMAMPFYILYAGQTIGLTGQTLGIITFAFTIAGTFSNLAWGAMADRRGFRGTFLLSISLWVLSTLLLLVASGLWATVLVFVGIGAAVQGFQNSSQNLTLEFGDRDNLPVRIAIANTASEVAGTIGPLLGGVLAAMLGFEAVFAASITFLVIGGIVVRIYVPEPRLRAERYS